MVWKEVQNICAEEKSWTFGIEYVPTWEQGNINGNIYTLDLGLLDFSNFFVNECGVLAG